MSSDSSSRRPPMQPVPLSARSNSTGRSDGDPAIFLDAADFIAAPGIAIGAPRGGNFAGGAPSGNSNAGGVPTGQGGNASDLDTLYRARQCLDSIEAWFRNCAHDENLRHLVEHARVMALRQMINYHRVCDFGMTEMSDVSPGMGPGLYAAPPSVGALKPPVPKTSGRENLITAFQRLWRPKKKGHAKPAQPATPLVFPTTDGTFLPTYYGGISVAPPPDTCDPRPCTLGRDPVYLPDSEGGGSWFHNAWLYTKSCSHRFLPVLPLSLPPPAQDFPPAFDDNGDGPDDGDDGPDDDNSPDSDGSFYESEDVNYYGAAGASGGKVAHFLRQVEAFHVHTKHSTPRPMHYDSSMQSVVDYPWPYDLEMGRRLFPSEFEGYRRTHEFEAPSCMCAHLDGQDYTESRIGIVETLNDDRDRNLSTLHGEYVAICAKQRCGYLLCLERFYAVGHLKLRKCRKRAQPLPPQELTCISSLGRSLSGGNGLFQVMQDAVVRGRPNGGLEAEDPADQQAEKSALYRHLQTGCLNFNRNTDPIQARAPNGPNPRRIRTRFEATPGDRPETPSPIRSTAGRPLFINRTPLEEVEEFDPDTEAESSDFEMPTLQELLAERRG
ncbi:hypothetical protein H1R20_g6239, partial [Candolleomyces eurysporus]